AARLLADRARARVLVRAFAVKSAWRWLVSALLCGAPLTGCSRAPDEPSVTISFVGDILLDSAPGRAIAGGGDPFAATDGMFRGVDLSIGNLECPVAAGGAAVEKVYTFRAAPSTLPVLHRHFDAVSVANNHSGDYGPDAFREPLEQLERAHVQHFRGGANLA